VMAGRWGEGGEMGGGSGRDEVKEVGYGGEKKWGGEGGYGGGLGGRGNWDTRAVGGGESGGGRGRKLGGGGGGGGGGEG